MNYECPTCGEPLPDDGCCDSVCTRIYFATDDLLDTKPRWSDHFDNDREAGAEITDADLADAFSNDYQQEAK